MLELRIGTRGSQLALAQTRIIAEKILCSYPDARIEIVAIKTQGDKNMTPFSSDVNGIKGMFTFEIEQALLSGEIDFAVHSLKDLPANTKFPVVAYSQRGNPFDALVLRMESVLQSDDFTRHTLHSRNFMQNISRPKNFTQEASCSQDFSRLPLHSRDFTQDISHAEDFTCSAKNFVIGSSSLRRRLQLERLYPDAKIIPVRGNINTRLAKLDDGEFSGLVLASAGLERLGLENRITKIFTPDEIMPAPGQGILACQGRPDEDYYYLEAVNDECSRDCAIAERSFARELGAGCNVPIGAYAEILDDERMRLRGLFIDERTRKFYRGEIEGRRDEAETLGKKLAEVIMS
ncbi:MAG: hydroxymethylbilane synthase [Synergistaceae bacterium]|nr:hydroxymethylbilane synthase [Synergistaceae bacterium]